MWKNIIQSDRPQMTIWRMRFACWITKATNTHSEYVILTAFPWQQWLRESAPILRHPYTACRANRNFRRINKKFSLLRFWTAFQRFMSGGMLRHVDEYIPTFWKTVVPSTQDQVVELFLVCLILNTKALSSFETSVFIYQSTRCNILHILNLQQYFKCK